MKTEVLSVLPFVGMWVVVIGLVAAELKPLARRTLWAVLAVVLSLPLWAGCTKEVLVYRDNPAGPSVVEPTPAPASLRFPQGIPESDILVLPGIPTLHNEVNAAMAEMFPNCAIGQERCDGLGYSPEAFHRVLVDKLRRRGLWAGMDIEWIRDEINVARDCKGTWENYKSWYYGGYPIWANPVSTPCAGSGGGAGGCKYTSYRGNTLIPASYCK